MSSLQPIRALLVSVAVLLCGCTDRQLPVEALRDSVELALRETVLRAEALSEEIEDVLQPVPLMRPGEEEELRRHLAPAHMVRARALGIRAGDRGRIDSLAAAGMLVALDDSTAHWILRRAGRSPSYVVPHTRAMMVDLGERFHRRLSEMGLPRYRMEVTSGLRTEEGQEALRERNDNAAVGVSAHEYGTTLDISYTAFAPPAELPASLRVEGPERLRPYLDRLAALTLESVSARKSRELQKILGDVLREAQADGIVLVTFERFQPVYHVTVARAQAGP